MNSGPLRQRVWHYEAMLWYVISKQQSSDWGYGGKDVVSSSAVSTLESMRIKQHLFHAAAYCTSLIKADLPYNSVSAFPSQLHQTSISEEEEAAESKQVMQLSLDGKITQPTSKSQHELLPRMNSSEKHCKVLYPNASQPISI